MADQDVSRRRFLQLSGSLTGAAALRSAIPGLAAALQAACDARDAGAPFAVLGAAEARELEAIVARIIPTTDTPGAREAGVIWFIDQAMSGFMSDRLKFLRGGLADFRASVVASHGEGQQFSGLSETAQDKHLATQDRTPFFGFLRMLTLFGMFGMPAYGGNKDHVGWKLLGLDPNQHAFAPPFGYYDAQFREENVNGD